MNKDDFIKKAQLIHGDKYCYDKFEYKSSKDKIIMICPTHGEFKQTIYAHLKGQGCPKCACKRKNYTTEDFIAEAKSKFGDTFDYSETKYINRRTKVYIKYGDSGFWQKPLEHLDSKTGFPHNRLIFNQTNQFTVDKFIIKAKEVHGDKYDYSKVTLKTYDDKVEIICSTHGSFMQNISHHLQGHGCPKCAKNKRYSTEEFIAKAKEIHGNKYDYTNSKYVRHNDKITIGCPIHGTFQQIPNSHLNGSGCPYCNESHLESELDRYLTEYGIRHERGKTFQNIKDKRPLPFDFYIPDYNIVIECQGIQHFTTNAFFYKKNDYIVLHDIIKHNGCKQLGLKLLYYTNIINCFELIKQQTEKFQGIYEYSNVYTDVDKLIQKITAIN